MVRPALGKGLGALIPENTKAPEKKEINKNEKLILQVDVDKIFPNKYQPRKFFDDDKLLELSESIRVKGVLNPILVREESSGHYQIIAGERRWRASKIAGIEKVPIVPLKVNNNEMLELAIIENVQRDDLNCLEEAESYQLLLNEFNLKHDQIAERVGKSRTAITNILRLLKLPYEIKNSLRANDISMGHARALLSLKTENIMMKVYKKIINEKLSVRETESLIRKITAQKDDIEINTKLKKTGKVKPEIKNIEEKIMESLGTKVQIKDNKNRGKIIIEYYNLDDFQRILGKLADNESSEY
jgi:ParB family chromosome partitioning protein